MIQDRIIKYLNFKGISKYKFYQTTGLSNGFLDKNRSIGSEKCNEIISHYPDINIEWLITGNGEMIKSIENEKKITKNDIKGLPLIPIDAMAGMSKGDSTILKLDCEYYSVPDFNDKADYLIRISGNSMSPKYYNGDIVACKRIPTDTFIQWGKVYVMDTIQGPLCKRIEQDGEKEILIVSDNPKYKPFKMNKKEIRSLAIVIGVIRLE